MHAWLVPFWGIVQFLAFFNTFKMGDVDVIKVLDIVTVSSVALVLAAKYFTNVDLALALRSATGDIVDSGYIAMNGNVTRQFHRIGMSKSFVDDTAHLTFSCSALPGRHQHSADIRLCTLELHPQPHRHTLEDFCDRHLQIYLCDSQPAIHLDW